MSRSGLGKTGKILAPAACEVSYRARCVPENPNGSQGDIAGVTDMMGRVLGLMPHPERHILPTQHPRWTREGLKREGDGLQMFRNAIEFFA